MAAASLAVMSGVVDLLTDASAPKLSANAVNTSGGGSAQKRIRVAAVSSLPLLLIVFWFLLGFVSTMRCLESTAITCGATAGKASVR